MKNTEFSNHAIFDKLKQFETRIHSEEAIKKVDMENLDFYRSTSKYIRSQLDKGITVLIYPNDLNDLHSHIDNSLNQLNAFLGNDNVGHLNNIEAYLYPALRTARGIPVPNIDDDFSYSALVNDLKTVADQKTGEIHSQVQSVKNEIMIIENELSKRETEIQNVSKSVVEKQSQIEGLSQNFQANFDQIRSAENTKFEVLRDDLKKNIDTKVKEIDDSTRALLTRLKTKEEEAKKLVNVIGNIGATGNYQSIANAHRDAANRWRTIAIFFMSILSLILIWTIWGVGSDQYDWKMALVRILSALVLTYPATYAVQESTKHRKLENSNRKAELELASINPFIEILDDEKKQQIKERLVDRYFGNNEVNIEKETDRSDDGVPLKVLDKVVDIFKEIKKS
jgi:hypothetical protein